MVLLCLYGGYTQISGPSPCYLPKSAVLCSGTGTRGAWEARNLIFSFASAVSFKINAPILWILGIPFLKDRESGRHVLILDFFFLILDFLFCEAYCSPFDSFLKSEVHLLQLGFPAPRNIQLGFHTGSSFPCQRNAPASLP